MFIQLKSSISKLVACLSLIAGVIVISGNNAKAQSYPIDCAILLCLSGGWPASAPCVRARTEFTRRITPWPVEPPVQIWRCPMGVSYGSVRPLTSAGRLFKAYENREFQSFPVPNALSVAGTFWNSEETATGFVSADHTLWLAQNRADIDISGPAFGFLRSIRVFHVQYASQHGDNQSNDCNRSEIVLVGTYGLQGQFSWNTSKISELPFAHTGLERWGTGCQNIFHRSVFVEWRDFEGRYGFEQVNY